jgi:hypothetical protein
MTIEYEQGPGGQCPVQAEGKINGLPFYFRSRGVSWSLSIAATPDGDPLEDEEVYFHAELYDGTFCQGPEWCSNKGKPVSDPVYLTNKEAGRAAALKVITPTKEMMKWLRDTGDGRKKI